MHWNKLWPIKKSFLLVKLFIRWFALINRPPCPFPFLVDKFISQGRLPHLLFYGPPGTGKTSTAKALAHNIFGKPTELSLSLLNCIGLVWF